MSWMFEAVAARGKRSAIAYATAHVPDCSSALHLCEHPSAVQVPSTCKPYVNPEFANHVPPLLQNSRSLSPGLKPKASLTPCPDVRCLTHRLHSSYHIGP